MGLQRVRHDWATELNWVQCLWWIIDEAAAWHFSPSAPPSVSPKLLQLCLILCDPINCSPSRLLCPWDSPSKNTGVGCYSLLQRISPIQHLLCLPALEVSSWEAPLYTFKMYLCFIAVRTAWKLCRNIDLKLGLESRVHSRWAERVRKCSLLEGTTWVPLGGKTWKWSTVQFVPSES